MPEKKLLECDYILNRIYILSVRYSRTYIQFSKELFRSTDAVQYNNKDKQTIL